MGETIYELRKTIQVIQSELDELGDPVSDKPELITSANLLRSNEHISRITKKQSDLLSAYSQYSKALEDMIDTIFDIQNDLKNLLKEQSKLLSEHTSSVSKSKKKPTIKKALKK
ncbi:hypothetical protein YTPLAS73_12790 [Nitrosarchaeum sp.]|nr:hypothetical protein YTPLAS73_12790 [Nitrosarchaeum sp.]